MDVYKNLALKSQRGSIHSGGMYGMGLFLPLIIYMAKIGLRNPL
jgi:hypothetical protein